jgi:hypothetical protein
MVILTATKQIEAQWTDVVARRSFEKLVRRWEDENKMYFSGIILKHRGVV